MITTIKEKDYNQIPHVCAQGFNEKPWGSDWYTIDQLDPKKMWVLM